ncbi:MAG: type II secretion system F family protein [Alphaproteobacteria bacterium]|nr:type II secretion system F family protein [Alphaproteobacteria bacterium]
MFDISLDLIITTICAFVAAISFIAFVFPILQRSEKSKRYKSIIENRKKTLFEAARQDIKNKGEKSVSAKDSVAMFFKVQQLAGEMGDKVRVQMLKAGIRHPMAPLVYIASQIGLPIILFLFTLLILSNVEKEPSDVMKFFVILGAVFSGFFLPRLLVKNTAMKREQELSLTFPDALDMMLICVQGGIGLEQAVERVAEEVAEHSPVLAEELGILSAEMAMLADRRAALSDFGKRVGGYGKSFATALIQAEQYGTSISQALRVMADELRDIRMSNAEQKAAALPPKLTVPMILFFLPALFIVIMGPAGIEASQAGLGG